MTEEKKSILEIQTAQAVLYDNEAEVFDDISAHEDPAGKLRSFLLESFDFDDKTVLEAGAGAGSMRQNIIQNAFLYRPWETIRFTVRLNRDVKAVFLDQAVQLAAKRYPYLCVKVCRQGISSIYYEYRTIWMAGNSRCSNLRQRP